MQTKHCQATKYQLLCTRSSSALYEDKTSHSSLLLIGLSFFSNSLR